MSDTKKPAEQEAIIKNQDKKEITMEDIPKELSEKELNQVQGGGRRRGPLS
jgi:bacteriocin-like protein